MRGLGTLVGADESVNLPAPPGQPCFCPLDRSGVGRHLDVGGARRARRDPSVEEPRGRTRVQTACRRRMFVSIHENIDQSIAYFAWRLERPGMEAIRPQSSAPLKRSIDRSGNANRHAGNPSSEGHFVGRLDQQMHVVALHRILNDPKPRPRRARKRSADGREHSRTTKARNAAPSAQRHVNGVPCLVFGPGLVHDACAVSARLSSGTPPLSTPRSEDERCLRRSLHLELATIL